MKTEYLLNQLINAVMDKDLSAAAHLITQGVNVNGYLDNAQMTPLHIAVLHKDVRLAKLLLLAGASTDSLTYPDRETPLDIAVSLEHIDMITLLMNWMRKKHLDLEDLIYLSKEERN